MYLPLKIKEILTIFNNANLQAFIVGGAVRDTLLKMKPEDYDIATAASPKNVMELFKGYRFVLSGIKHGTVGIIYQGIYVEVTTFRKEEEYFDHRHPQKVTFVDDLKTDLSRRDFTINALAYNEEIYDFFNGIDDLNKKIIRAVGNPKIRFEEDGLRVLRALRFSSVLNFDIERETKKAIFAQKNMILYSSKERIRIEFDKLLLGSGISRIIEEYLEVIEVFIPSIKSFINNKEEVFKIAKAIEKIEPDICTRLAMLCFYPYHFANGILNYDISNIDLIRLELSDLKYSKKNVDLISNILFLTDINPEINDYETRKLLKCYNKNVILKAVKIRELYEDAVYSMLEERIIKNSIKCNRLDQMAINGNDLLMLGYDNSSDLKKTLEFLLDEIISDKIANKRKDLINRAQEILEKKTGE